LLSTRWLPDPPIFHPVTNVQIERDWNVKASGFLTRFEIDAD